MSPISRGFQGRCRAEADPAGAPPGQYVTYDFRQNPRADVECSMTIVVVGGSGLIGSKLVTMLKRARNANDLFFCLRIYLLLTSNCLVARPLHQSEYSCCYSC